MKYWIVTAVRQDQKFRVDKNGKLCVFSTDIDFNTQLFTKYELPDVIEKFLVLYPKGLKIQMEEI